MSNKDPEALTVQQMDNKIEELIGKLCKESFRPDIVVGSSAGGSILARIFSFKTGCGFAPYSIRVKGSVEKLDINKLSSGNWKILLLDDSNSDANKITSIDVIKTLRPEVNQDAVMESLLSSMTDYIKEVAFREPENLSYARKWTFQKETLKQVTDSKTAENILNELLAITKKDDDSAPVMIERYARETKKPGRSKEQKAESEETIIKKQLEALKKKKTNDITCESVANLLESNQIKTGKDTPLFKNLEIRACSFSDQEVPESNSDFTLEWPEGHPIMPWDQKTKLMEEFLNQTRKSDIPWREEMVTEVKNQYIDSNKELSEFYAEYPFKEPIDGINDAEASITGLVYEFMIIDESRTMPESFYSWCEEKGHRFYRKTNAEGLFIPVIRHEENPFEYSIKCHKDLYLIELKTSSLKRKDDKTLCSRDRSCKIKDQMKDDQECTVCKDFKTTFSFLFGEEKPGLYQWLDRKGFITNIEYQIYLDNVKVKILSKIDLFELIKKFQK